MSSVISTAAVISSSSGKKAKKERVRNIVKMLNGGSEDSSSDYVEEEEISSDDEDIQFGLKKAIGLDPNDLKHYNGQYQSPMNGSQYLLNTMRERKNLPKVVVADPAIIQAKLEKVKELENVKKLKLKNGESKTDYDVEMQTLQTEESTECTDTDNNDEDNEDAWLESGSKTALFPNYAWEKEALEQFKKLREKIDRWRVQIEEKTFTVHLSEDLELPNTVGEWFQFCFGRSIPFDIRSGKFKKSAFKITRGTTINKFSKSYLTAFFTNVTEIQEPHNHDSKANISTKSDIFKNEDLSSSDLNTSLASLSIEEEENEHECLSDEQQQNSIDRSTELPKVFPHTGHAPSLSILLNIPQRSFEKLITCQLRWLHENYNKFLNKRHCEWVYGLLVCIQTPLEASVISDLREIAKSCKKQRQIISHLISKKNSIDKFELDNNSNLSMYLTSLNLFIILVGHYFRQHDLLEEL